MDNDLITIIIPVYNVEEYIEMCLESVQVQTYDNIEIILINDGSTDNSKKICEKYTNMDSRFKIINKKNEGVSAARNVGLQKANGKYVTFVDSDDYIDKNYIFYLYNQIIKNNTDISICGTIDVDENGDYKRYSKNYVEEIDSIKALQELLNEEYYTSVVWAKMYKKELVQNIKFNNEIKIAEDLDFLYKVIGKAKTISVNTNKKLYYYRMRKNSLTSKEYNRNWENEIKLCKDIIEDCKKNNINIVSNAIRRYIRINCTCMIKILKYCKDDKKNYNKLKKNIKQYEKMYMRDTNIGLKLKIKMILLLYYKNISRVIFK